jgi:hypothetical protein
MSSWEVFNKESRAVYSMKNWWKETAKNITNW